MARLHVYSYGAVAIGLIALAGCSHTSVQDEVRAGAYGRARVELVDALPSDRSNRNYVLHRMSLALVELADGTPDSAEETVNEVFDMLRTAGLNADKTVGTFFVSEGAVRIWKGEPFEQAMMYVYTAMQKAMRGEWDNARAAASSSLFLLRDFGESAGGGRKTEQQIAEAAARKEQQGDGGYLDNGYAVIETDFALGYLFAGIANAALGRDEEASDYFGKAERYAPQLAPVTARLREGSYDTVLIADYGLGPEKVAYGHDKVFSKFVPRAGWSTDFAGLNVSAAGASESFPIACDLNLMAQDHKWRGVEEIRIAKSILGTALLVGGAVGLSQADSSEEAMAYAAVALIGLAAKASAEADTRHCDILPQRVYVAPLMLGAGSPVSVQVAQRPGSRVEIPWVAGPAGGEPVKLIYLRMTPNHSGESAWASSGQVVYANDFSAEPVPGGDLPYILGGRCVRSPSAETLSRYQQAGNLTNLTLVDLENLYRDEGISLAVEDTERGVWGMHILEGGSSLYSPLPGSIGYLRLYCQPHEPYEARSDAVRQLQAECAGRGGM